MNTPTAGARRTTGARRKRRRARTSPEPAGIDIRKEQRNLFALVLRSEPNRRGKPYSERTIGAYLDAVDSLGRWLTLAGHVDGYDTLTLGQLNAYLSDYLDRHTLGGTVTKEGNLRVFLKHLAEEYGGEDLWEDHQRHRYQRQEEHPAVLDPALITALLNVTSVKTFEDRRDHALIRVLLSGVRRQEVAALGVEDLDLTSATKTAAVVGLQGLQAAAFLSATETSSRSSGGWPTVPGIGGWPTHRRRVRCGSRRRLETASPATGCT